MRRYVCLIAALAAFSCCGCARNRQPAKPPLKQSEAGHIVIGPYVQPGPDPDMISYLRIVWWSDAPGAAALEVRRDDGLGGTMPAETVAMEGLYRHSVLLISTDALISEMVMATVTVDGKLYTAPPQRVSFPGGHTERPFRFAAVGDEGAGNVPERKIANLIAKEKPEVLVIPGDVVYNSGEFSEYRKNLFPYFGKLMSTVPILPSLGNHDVGNPQHLGRPYREVWMPPENWLPPKESKTVYTILRRRANKGEGPLPRDEWSLRNYSADAGGCHFVCLDSTADHDTMRDLIVPWLEKDLAKARKEGAQWLIAFWHHPPYTHGGYRDNSLQWNDIRELYVPMMRKYGVQIVLNGHDHGCQHMRKDGVDYIVTAGGGAKLYPIVKGYSANDMPVLSASDDQLHSFTVFEKSADGTTMSVRQIDENGHQVDAFDLHRGR